MSHEAIFLENFINAVDFQDQVEMTLETELKSLPEWDSLAALGVIVMCDLEYQVTLTGAQLSECIFLGDIYNIVSKKT